MTTHSRFSVSEILKGKRIAVIGGTGAEGGGLALRWAAGGLPIVIGSRDGQKAKDAADEMMALLPEADISGADNLDAASGADLVVLAVPYAGQRATAFAIKSALVGKILVDVTAPLVPPAVSVVQLPDGGSCVAALQAALGPEVRVAAAFQNISASHLRDLDWRPDCDVLVAADEKETRDLVIALAQAAGFRGIAAGKLANAAALEALTSVLIAINRAYKVQGSGLRITGLGEES